MKKLFVLFLLPLFSFNFLADWKTFNLDDRFSVSFPGEPTQREMSGNDIYVVDVNSTSRCMVMIMDFQKMGMDSAQLAEEFSSPESFEEFRTGLIQQMPGSTIITEKVGNWQGRKTFEYFINMGKKSGELNYMYNKNFFVGTKMYSVNFYQTEEKKSPENERFFNSIKIK